jgi:hypothetical protein
VSPRQRLRRPPPTQGPRLRVPDRADEPPDAQPPLFSLRYLDRRTHSLAACQQREKAAFADTLDRLSQLSWSELRLSPRHGLGYEQIPRQAIRAPIPPHITEDVQRFIAFRFFGQAPMVGYRVQAVLYILWLDRTFTLYEHS